VNVTSSFFDLRETLLSLPSLGFKRCRSLYISEEKACCSFFSGAEYGNDGQPHYQDDADVPRQKNDWVRVTVVAFLSKVRIHFIIIAASDDI